MENEAAAARRTVAEIDAEIARVKAELADVHGTEAEVYARIVGYYRSVRQWNAGKREEYGKRKLFVENPQETAARLEAAQGNGGGTLGRCGHPGLAWKCPNSRAGGCARTSGPCFIEESLAAAGEMCSCGNEAVPMAHVEKEAVHEV